MKPIQNDTPVVYLGGHFDPMDALEPKRAIAVPQKLSLEECRKLMPWSEMRDTELQAEIDKVYRFASIISAKVATTDTDHINWTLSDDPSGEDELLRVV